MIHGNYFSELNLKESYCLFNYTSNGSRSPSITSVYIQVSFAPGDRSWEKCRKTFLARGALWENVLAAGLLKSSRKCDFEESLEILLRLEVYSWRAVFRSTLPTSLNLIKLSECFYIALWRRKWRIVSRFYQTDLLFSLHHSPPKTFLNDFAVAAKRNVLSQSAYVEIYCRFCNVNFYSWQSLFPFFLGHSHHTAAASSLSPAFPIRKIPSTFLSGNKTQNGLVGTMEEFKRMKLTFLTFESSRFSTP